MIAHLGPIFLWDGGYRQIYLNSFPDLAFIVFNSRSAKRMHAHTHACSCPHTHWHTHSTHHFLQSHPASTAILGCSFFPPVFLIHIHKQAEMITRSGLVEINLGTWNRNTHTHGISMHGLNTFVLKIKVQFVCSDSYCATCACAKEYIFKKMFFKPHSNLPVISQCNK